MKQLLMIVLASSVSCLVACSKSAPPGPAMPAASARTNVAGSVCDLKFLSSSDVANVLTSPIVRPKDIPGDAQSCSFETGGFASVTVSLRPGLGRNTVNSWLAGKMPVPATPLPGVGDSAAWQPDLHEVISQRNNVLCDIQVSAGRREINGGDAELPQRLGALCDKVLTRYGNHLRA